MLFQKKPFTHSKNYDRNIMMILLLMNDILQNVSHFLQRAQQAIKNVYSSLLEF